MTLHRHLLAAAVATLVLAACNAPAPPAPPATQDPSGGQSASPQTALGRQVERAMAEARREMATENISLNDGLKIGPQMHRKDQSNLPKAEITPAGDLLVEGQAVAIDAAQRALLLKYRGHITALAEAGMALGVKGADLGMQAAGAAISGIFTGKTDQIEQRVEAEAGKIEVEARKLCAGLAPMLATQTQLAASLPAFVPYARLTQADVDDCLRDKDGASVRAEIRDEIRQEVRDGVRSSVREAIGTREPARNAAEEAEAASESTTR